MSDRLQKFLMASGAFAVGVGLIFFGLLVTHQLVWVSAGVFFSVVGVAALTLTFAPTVPGPLGDFLRSPQVSVLILAAVLVALCVTAVLGIVGSAVRR